MYMSKGYKHRNHHKNDGRTPHHHAPQPRKKDQHEADRLAALKAQREAERLAALAPKPAAAQPATNLPAKKKTASPAQQTKVRKKTATTAAKAHAQARLKAQQAADDAKRETETLNALSASDLVGEWTLVHRGRRRSHIQVRPRSISAGAAEQQPAASRPAPLRTQSAASFFISRWHAGPPKANNIAPNIESHDEFPALTK